MVVKGNSTPKKNIYSVPNDSLDDNLNSVWMLFQLSDAHTCSKCSTGHDGKKDKPRGYRPLFVVVFSLEDKTGSKSPAAPTAHAHNRLLLPERGVAVSLLVAERPVYYGVAHRYIVDTACQSCTDGYRIENMNGGYIRGI
jgi:hypothetical protein